MYIYIYLALLAITFVLTSLYIAYEDGELGGLITFSLLNVFYVIIFVAYRTLKFFAMKSLEKQIGREPKFSDYKKIGLGRSDSTSWKGLWTILRYREEEDDWRN